MSAPRRVSLPRMSPGFLPQTLERTSVPCLVRWPKEGVMRGGRCWEHVTLAPRTAATASGLWPTARATDGSKGGPGQRNGRGKADSLPGAVVEDWATPTTRDGKDGAHVPGVKENSLLGRQVWVPGLPVRLNPDWVEMLMGWPARWTDTAGPHAATSHNTLLSPPVQSSENGGTTAPNVFTPLGTGGFHSALLPLGEPSMINPPTPPATPATLPRVFFNPDPRDTHRKNPALMDVLATRRNPLEQLSASSVKDAERCPRLFWLRNVAGVRVEQRMAAAVEGTAMHAQYEDHHKKNTPLVHGSLRAAVDAGHVPARGTPGWCLEQEFWLEVPVTVPGITPHRPVLFHGFIDMVRVPPETVGRRAYVKDWKTKENKEKAVRYALSPKVLRTDFQLQLYTLWVFDTAPWIDEVEVTHIYASRDNKDPCSHPVSAVFTRAQDLGALWKRVSSTAESVVLDAHKAGTWEAATPEWSACEDYNGCAFEALCWDKDPSELDDDFAGLFEQEDPVPSPFANQPFPGLNPPDGLPPGAALPSGPTKGEKKMDLAAMLNAAAAAPTPTPQPPPATLPPTTNSVAAALAPVSAASVVSTFFGGATAPAPAAGGPAPGGDPVLDLLNAAMGKASPATPTPSQVLNPAVATAPAAVAAAAAVLQAPPREALAFSNPNPAQVTPAATTPAPTDSGGGPQLQAMRAIAAAVQAQNEKLDRLLTHLGVR